MACPKSGHALARAPIILQHMSTAIEAIELLDRMRRRAALPTPATRKAIRLAAGRTLEEIGRACGVSHEAIRLWESGRRAPGEANLVRYAAVLEALQEELLTRGGGREEVNPRAAA